MPDRSRSLVKYAFVNQYNIIALAGAGGLSVAVQSWIPAVAAVAGEIIWLVMSPSTPLFRSWAAAQTAGEERTQRAMQTAQATRRLDDAYGTRVNQLGHSVEEIRRLAAERQMDPGVFER